MNFLEKVEKNVGIVVTVLFCLIFLKQCGISREQKKITKRLDSIDSSLVNTPSKNDLNIEGLKISKRTLYDWNSVVRTSVRPDDRMNEYDKEIEKLKGNDKK
jgi:hypothetical protein